MENAVNKRDERGHADNEHTAAVRWRECEACGALYTDRKVCGCDQPTRATITPTPATWSRLHTALLIAWVLVTLALIAAGQ